MIKVYENFNFSQVGQAQSLLESEGIPTFIRNEFASSVMGEVPFVEVCPQLYILDPEQEKQARELLQPFATPPLASDWLCPQCGLEIEGPFGQCWSCGQLRPA